MKTTNRLINFFINWLEPSRANFIEQVLHPAPPKEKITKIDILYKELEKLMQEVEDLDTADSRLFLKEFGLDYYDDIFWHDEVPSFYGFGEAGALRYMIAHYKTFLKQYK